MMGQKRKWGTPLLFAMIIAVASVPPALAADRQTLTRNASAALSQLTASNTAAKLLASKAKGVLVFPNILKAGFMFGAHVGDGVLLTNGSPRGYYNSLAASYGFQAGIQKFGYAMFFMNNDALAYLNRSGGWEVGLGPSIVVVDAGMGKSMTSTTITKDVYAFIFNQKGLMAGLGIQGSKITRLAD